MACNAVTIYDTIEYISDGEYVVDEYYLKELVEAKVIMTVANELGLFDGVCWDDALDDMYPGLGETPNHVADSLVGQIHDMF